LGDDRLGGCRQSCSQLSQVPFEVRLPAGQFLNALMRLDGSNDQPDGHDQGKPDHEQDNEHRLDRHLRFSRG
jgi:hypothetical protein